MQGQVRIFWCASSTTSLDENLTSPVRKEERDIVEGSQRASLKYNDEDFMSHVMRLVLARATTRVANAVIRVRVAHMLAVVTDNKLLRGYRQCFPLRLLSLRNQSSLSQSLTHLYAHKHCSKVVTYSVLLTKTCGSAQVQHR